MTSEILAALRAVLPAEHDRIALHEPQLAGNEWIYVKDCLDSGWVSSAGRYVERFEQQLRDVTGSGHAVATTNGTAALHLALIGAGVAREEEVILPALTFVATANAIAYCGAVPHLIDSEEATLGLDPRRLAEHLDGLAEQRDNGLYNRNTGRRIAAVVCTHVFGHPVDLDPLATLCREFGLPLIEDAAEALGSRYKGRHVGTRGHLAALSFNGNKIVTTGGGGAVVTNDATLAERLRHLSTTAKRPHPWRYDHDAVGYNYRLPNINAALGCAQLEQLGDFLAAKRRLAERYEAAFAALRGADFVQEPPFAISNYWLNAIRLERADVSLRDEILKALHGTGILARPAWTLMHRLPMFRDAPGMALPVAERLEASLISLPSSVDLA